MKSVSFCIFLIFYGLIPAAGSTDAIEARLFHEMDIQISPSEHRIEVLDRLNLPRVENGIYIFSLHRGLAPALVDTPGTLTMIPSGGDGIFERYKLIIPKDVQIATLRYAGIIHHPLEAYGKEQSRGFRDSPGTIGEGGVYLQGRTHWYPIFEELDQIEFKLNIQLPEKWKAVSQGHSEPVTHSGRNTIHWECLKPQEEIYLIAAPFHLYEKKFKNISAQVYLRQQDPELARQYMDATGLYMDIYESLLGAYPYSKFALVENFWETGFGMPSFTLLGSRVIRLPFILHSSYPHEILHNWWGNGVYVDYPGGNWCEGLTAYLADHLIKEQRGQGAEHRLQSLQKYTDYALKERDFALADFRGRYSSASEAVGYGKSMMLFHMLRLELGDAQFIAGLRDFYANHLFKRASFEDLRVSFQKVSKKDLKGFFQQWVNGVGAPAISLIKPALKELDKGFELEFTLSQTQAGEAFNLSIPIAITTQDSTKSLQQILHMDTKSRTFKIGLDSRPLRLDIDPEFDLFRALDVEEIPPAFTRVFGSQKMIVILPRAAHSPMKEALEKFAQDFSKMGPEEVNILWDDQIEKLPELNTVAILGWSNRFYPNIVEDLKSYPIDLQVDTFKLEEKPYDKSSHAVAFAYRRPDPRHTPIAFIAAGIPESLVGLGRKLPHYHKYSFLVFEGSEPQNVGKGQWPVQKSPMSAYLQGSVEMASLSKRNPLFVPKKIFDRSRMLADIQFLASEDLQGRGFGEPGLEKAAQYIAKAFAEAGLKPLTGTKQPYFHSFQANGGDPERKVILNNIIGVIPGINPAFASQSLVIGAHYDHLGLGWPSVRHGQKGQIHHGADDNASGIAVLLELARVLKAYPEPPRTIVFVAFSGEEAGRLGSLEYVKNQSLFPASKILAMINLDTVGRLGNNKVLVLGSQSASEWQHIFRGVSYVTGIPTAMVQENLDSSDHNSFHEAGIPAIQLFSGPNSDYHRPSDTMDKIDGEGLVKIAAILKESVEYLAGRKEPLTSTLPDSKQQNDKSPKTNRKVSLGTVPDFSYQGQGYRLDGTVDGSPARNAGLQKGDIILKIENQDVNGLRDLSRILKSLQPGQKISITYQRSQSILSADITLKNN